LNCFTASSYWPCLSISTPWAFARVAPCLASPSAPLPSPRLELLCALECWAPAAP